MRHSWPIVELAALLRQRKKFIAIDDLTAYKRPRVQLHAQGIVLRDDVPGALIKTKTQQVCAAGEFLVAEIDAKVGGFGIVPDNLNGSIVSSHYFLFVIDESRLHRRFFDYFIRTRTFRNQVEAQGSTNYAAIRPTDVLSYRMPLPPLPEQRRIVARIEELAVDIQTASRLRQEAEAESVALIASTRRSLIGDSPAPDWVSVRQFVVEIESGRSPQCEPRPAIKDEWGVLKVGAVSFGAFDERENKALPVGSPIERRYEVRSGDFLMSRANTTELVGACAILGKTRPRLLLSDKTFRFHFRRETEIVPEWVDHVFKSPALRQQIERGASGTSPTMKNISKDKVLSLLVPPHSSEQQRIVVSRLNGLRTHVARLTGLQTESAAELDALLPAILDRAFRGEF